MDKHLLGQPGEGGIHFDCNRPMLLIYLYRKNPTISDTRKFAVFTLKVEQDGFSLQ